jgi:hypothetical protein
MDRLGVCLSLACAVQCLAAPVLFTTLPMAGLGFFLDGPLEIILLGASMTLATGSLGWGFRVHRHWRVFGVLTAAVGMILLGRFAVDEPYELVLVVSGAVLLGAGHLCNRALCRACLRCQGEEGHGTG